MKAIKWFIELFTDAQNRPEIKAVLGIGVIGQSFGWLWGRGDVTGFLMIFSAGLVLLGIKTLEDLKLDAKKGE